MLHHFLKAKMTTRYVGKFLPIYNIIITFMECYIIVNQKLIAVFVKNL